MIMGCGQRCMCYIWQQNEYYNYYDLLCVYHVKVSSISKFILMYATVTCMNFYVCYCRDVHHIILYTMSKIIIIMSC